MINIILNITISLNKFNKIKNNKEEKIITIV